CEKYKKATDIKKDKHEAFYNWGIALGAIAELKEGKQKEQFLKEACEKYKKATDIKKDKHEAFNNWSGTLILLSYIKKGKQQQEALRNAIEKAKKANEIKEGEGCYNIACIHSLLNESEEALHYLEKAIEYNPSYKKDAQGDGDFAPLKSNKKLNKKFEELCT
ncbi:MAG: tetratricopeptide repeat protein, partial [Nitrospinae bacterium]|nr:tetratricopeptide repeat protein [Nitrospinota bacterium]